MQDAIWVQVMYSKAYLQKEFPNQLFLKLYNSLLQFIG